MVTPGFVHWSRAVTKFELTGRPKDIFRVAKYPTATSTDEPFPKIDEALTELLRDSTWVLLHGAPSSGKTFHAFLQAKHFRNGHSFYAPVEELDVDSVSGLWQRNSEPALWIVDDAQRDLENAEAILALFHDFDLHSDGHQLLMASWTLPAFAQGFAALEIQKSVGGLKTVLSRQLKDLPPDDVLEAFANDRTLGLSELVCIARSEGRLVPAELPRYRRFAAQQIASKLDHSEFDLLQKVALASAIGAGWVVTPELSHEERSLLAKELVIAGASGISMRDDALARSLAINLAGEDGRSTTELLLWNVRELLSKPINIAALIRRLGRVSINDVRVWAGDRPLAAAEDRTLLYDLWELASSQIVQRIESGPVVIKAVAPYIRAANHPLASEALLKFWRDNQDALTNEIRTDHNALLKAAELASDLPQHQELRKGVTDATTVDTAVAAFKAADRGSQLQLLRNLKRIDSSVPERFFRAAFSADEISRTVTSQLPREMRRFMTTSSEAGLGRVAVEILEKIPSEKLRDLILHHPSEIAKTFADPRHDKLHAAAARALQQVTAQDVQQVKWTDPGDVIAWIHLAAVSRRTDLAAPGILDEAVDLVFTHGTQGEVVDLAHAAARFRRTPLAKGIAERFRQRPGTHSDLRAVCLIDQVIGQTLVRAHARGQIEQNLAGGDTWAVFWLLSLVLLHDPQNAAAMAAIIDESWTPKRPVELDDLAVAGLLHLITGRSRSDLTLRPPLAGEAVPESPLMFAHSFGATASLAANSPFRNEWLGLLVDKAIDLPRRFRQVWPKQTAPERRLIVSLIEGGLSRSLDEQSSQTKERLAVALSTQANDWFWEADQYSRFRLLIALGKKEELRVIATRAIGWQRTPKVWHIATLAMMTSYTAHAIHSPDLTKTAIDLLKAAITKTHYAPYKRAFRNLLCGIEKRPGLPWQGELMVYDPVCRALNGDRLAAADMKYLLHSEETALLSALFP